AFTIGMLGNVFIGLVNFSDWVRNQKITLNNFILMCLAISRISSLLVVFFDMTVQELAPHIFDSYILVCCWDIFWVVTDQLSTWFATCLSIFYFLKIAHFSHPVFLWLKWRIRGVLVVYLAFSSFSLIFFFLLFETIPILRNIYTITKSNLTLFADTNKAIAVKKLVAFDLMYLVPLLVSLASLFLLFSSLVKHSRNFNIIFTNSKDSRAQVHKKAMKMLLSFLILFIIHIFFMQMVRWLFTYVPTKGSSNFVMLILIIFPLSHSFILILGNSKLRQTAMNSPEPLLTLAYLFFAKETTASVSAYILLITVSVEFIMGNLGNLFTVLVNITDWVKRRKTSFIDQIFTTLAISRISLLYSLITSFLVSEWYPAIKITRRLARQAIISWAVTNHFSIWLATCLSIFYFLKIANFSNSIFLHLKWRVKKMVSVTLLASLLLLFLNILIINTHIDIFFGEVEAKMFFRGISSNYTKFSRLVLLTNTVFTLIPFTVTLTMFLLLIFSLWSHLKNMQLNATGFRDVSATAHIKALKMVVTFLLLYTVFVLSLLLQFCNIVFHQKASVSLLFWAIGVAFPSGHSYVLILGNARLRQAFLSMMRWLGCSKNDLKMIQLTTWDGVTGFVHVELLLCLILEFIIGNLGNVFVVLVNIMDWMKRRKISSVDQILTALAISRIALLWSLIASLFALPSYNALTITRTMIRFLKIFWTVANHFSIWFATCLSILYFLKIANFSNYIFLYLKWRVKRVVSMTLLVSLLILFLNILVINTYIDVWIGGHKTNMSFNAISSNFIQLSRIVSLVNIMFTLTPFTVSLTMLLLLIFSLWRHLKYIQHNTQGSRDVSTTAHIKALQTLVAFLLLYMVFFLSLLSLCWNFDIKQKSLRILFLQAMGIAFPSAHSCVLILENRKLNQSLLSVLWCMRCRKKFQNVFALVLQYWDVTLLIILYIEFIIGILGNAFMALVNIMDWVKRRNISVVDLILTALAISRIAFLLIMVIIFLISELYSVLATSEKILRIVFLFWLLTSHFSIWLATCLSIFYFLKIANFSSALLLYLKWRVINVVIVTLLVSVLILFVNIVINTHINVWIDWYKANTSYSSTINNVTQLSKFVLLTHTMFTLIPFTMSLITFILLIFSLWRHLKNIKHNAVGSRDISITAHIKTLQTVVAFLLLYTVFFLALALQYWIYKAHPRNLANLFLEDAGLIFPSGHSCVLIMTHSKLRQALLSMIWLVVRYSDGRVEENQMEKKLKNLHQANYQQWSQSIVFNTVKKELCREDLLVSGTEPFASTPVCITVAKFHMVQIVFALCLSVVSIFSVLESFYNRKTGTKKPWLFLRPRGTSCCLGAFS
ncbi:taste receptor type 2 member 140-like, partial [Sigmodon hispidus]